MSTLFTHTPGDAADRRALRDTALLTRACCCPARPAVQVIMPPAPERPHETDLLLCEHHFRFSREALAATGASVRRLRD
jgi:hypothetical protein